MVLPDSGLKLGWGVAIGIGLVLGTLLVMQTGGSKFAFLHVLYLPVCVAGLVFGLRGGVLAGAAAGVLIGMVPIDTRTGEEQLTQNWLYRALFFCLVGAVVGAGADLLRKQMARLAWLNDHDVRSGMLARTGLLKALRQMIESTGPGEERSVVVVHMNNFLEIQNTFGVEFGERLLTLIRERWVSAVPEGTALAMVQPDRLSVVFPNTEEALRLRPELEAKMHEPYLVDDIPVYINFSMGAARYPTHASTAETWLQKASIAMHEATSKKLTYALYDLENDRTSRDNLILLGQIPAAIARREFCVWHQAKLSLPERRLCGTEALVRWSHAQLGTVMPGAFIPQAEETALINQLTRSVIDAALQDLATGSAAGMALSMAFNMSAQNFHDPSLFTYLHDRTRSLNLDPQCIEIEVTESAVMSDFSVCSRTISRMRDLGYRIAVDDFGTGQSSLSYLRRLPVTTLKIDQSFIRHLATSEADQKIVRTIISLAKLFELETVAEGVEDVAVLPLLADWGCDYAQGYALHRPAPFADFLQWAQTQTASL